MYLPNTLFLYNSIKYHKYTFNFKMEGIVRNLNQVMLLTGNKRKARGLLI